MCTVNGGMDDRQKGKGQAAEMAQGLRAPAALSVNLV